MQHILICITSPLRGMCFKIAFGVLALFLTLLFDVMVINLNGKAENLYYIAATEFIMLNLNMYVYLLLSIMTAMNYWRIFDEYIEEEQIWESTYRLIWFKDLNSIYEKWTSWVLIMVFLCISPFTAMNIFITSIIVKRRGRNCNFYKSLLIIVELWFILLTIPWLQLIYSPIETNKSLNDDNNFFNKLAIFTTILRIFWSLLKIIHSKEWVKISNNWAIVNSNQIKRVETRFIFTQNIHSNLFENSNHWSIWYQNYKDSDQIWQLNCEHIFCLAWTTKWFKISNTCPLWKKKQKDILVYKIKSKH